MLFLQLINAILGSGLLGLPFIFKRVGLFGGIAILTIVCLFIYFSGIIMIQPLPKNATTKLSLTSYVKDSLQQKWKTNICIAIIISGIMIQEFGALVSYIFIITSDLKIINPAAVGFLLFIFLLWLSSMDITKISWLSIITMTVFLCYKTMYIFMPNRLMCQNNTTNNTTNVDVLLVWKATSTCFFASICHTTLGSVACSHGSRKTKIHFSICILVVYILYVVSATCDYFTFPQIDDNILDTFTQCVYGARIVVMLYKSSIITTIPVLFISICGEFPETNPIIIKGIGLFAAILVANFATTLGWILAIFGFIGGIINVFMVPVIMQLVVREHIPS